MNAQAPKARQARPPEVRPPDARSQDVRAPDVRSQRLAAILQLETTLRAAETLEQVFFIVTNEIQRIVPFDTAVVWTYKGRQPTIAAATAVASVDPATDFGAAIRSLADAAVRQGGDRKLVALDKSAMLDGTWPASAPAQALSVPLGPAAQPFGGLLLFRASAWQSGEQWAVQHLAAAASFSAERFVRPRRSLKRWLRKRNLVVAAVLLLGLSLLPIRQSVLAPGEVVAVDPVVLAAPYAGVVKEIMVAPSATVVAGQPLFKLDDTDIRGKRDIAESQLKVAKAEWHSAQQKAFGDQRSNNEVQVLQRRIELREAEIAYYSELLSRLTVTAPSDGVVVMGDRDEWIGRPVRVGERVMTIARPSATQLQIWVPVDDAIALATGVPVLFFTNVDPLDPVDADIRQTSYEAEMSPNEVLSYRVKATIQGTKPLRLGLRGTAKVYGERVTLFYYLMRRPLAVVRRTLGL